MAGQIDRRTLVRLGLGVSALGLVGCSAPKPQATPTPVSFANWVASRQAPYLIAHRGAGTTIPEHSLPGYLQALEWGAQAIELSVVMSSDGVLYCHHDLALDRTTTLTGDAATVPSSVLDTGLIDIPRLGPAWSGDNRPAIPRLEAALDEVGGRAVLCIEAKNFDAYEPVMKLLDQRGLLDQVMVKTTYNSSRVDKAHKANLPVFSYIGSIEDAAENVDAAAARLNPSDALVLPARQGGGPFLGDDVIKRAVDSGIPVWVFTVNRRSEVERFSALGVSGFVTPCLGYLNDSVPVASADTFSSGRIAPGLTTRDPYSDAYALGWDTAEAVELTGEGARYVCLGDLSPVARPEAFRVELEVAITSSAGSATDSFEFAFGCLDDTYCTEAETGYAATLGGDGFLRLSIRSAGGLQELGTPGQAHPLAPGEWTTLAITVTAVQVSCAVGGAATISANDTTWRGGYLHVGRSAGVARFAVRHLSVVPL